MSSGIIKKMLCSLLFVIAVLIVFDTASAAKKEERKVRPFFILPTAPEFEPIDNSKVNIVCDCLTLLPRHLDSIPSSLPKSFPLASLARETQVCGNDGLTYASACVALCQQRSIHSFASCPGHDSMSTPSSVVVTSPRGILMSPSTVKEEMKKAKATKVKNPQKGGLNMDAPVDVQRYSADGFVYLGRARERELPRLALSKSSTEEESTDENEGPLFLPYANETSIAMYEGEEEELETSPTPLKRGLRVVRIDPNTGDVYAESTPISFVELSRFIKANNLTHGTKAWDPKGAKGIEADGAAALEFQEEEEKEKESETSSQPSCPAASQDTRFVQGDEGAVSGAKQCLFCCGREDRVKVNRSRLDRLPWRATAYVSPVGCTGQLIGARSVITAGHCAFGPGGTNAIKGVAAAFDRQFRMQPYGVSPVTAIDVSASYFNRPQAGRNDWAVATLQLPVGNRAGFLGLPGPSACSDSGTWGTLLSGYPGDKEPFPSAYEHRPQGVCEPCRLNKACKAFYPRTKCDAYPGNSGSAHVTLFNNKVRALLSSGNCDFNFSTKLIGNTARQILRIVNRTPSAVASDDNPTPSQVKKEGDAGARSSKRDKAKKMKKKRKEGKDGKGETEDDDGEDLANEEDDSPMMIEEEGDMKSSPQSPDNA